eukprot:54980-Alexandrium_andersonii.AAC.1
MVYRLSLLMWWWGQADPTPSTAQPSVASYSGSRLSRAERGGAYGLRHFAPSAIRSTGPAWQWLTA